MAVKIRKPYDPSQREQITFKKPSKAKQSFMDECNINTIMSKYEKTGMIEHLARTEGQYGDFSEIHDYHSALDQIILAQDAFESLPAQVRARFSNDPGEFLLFFQDPRNADEARRLGLLPPGSEEKKAASPRQEDPPVGGSDIPKSEPSAPASAQQSSS